MGPAEVVTRGDLPALSVLYPLQLGSRRELEPFARLVDSTTAERLYVGQSLLLETHSVLAALLGTGPKVPVGTSVTLTPLRHPAEAALQARTLASLSGHSYVAGFGVAEPRIVAALRGRPYESPRTAALDYLRAIRGLLKGDEVHVAGPYAPTDLALPAVTEHPAVHLGLGVLRPGMAETAGAVADVAITWLTPPHYIRKTLVPALASGAARAGRKMPRLIAVVHTGLTLGGRDPAEVLAQAAHAHLQGPHYCAMLANAGIKADPARPRKTAMSLLAWDGMAHGSVGRVIDTLAAYGRAGVDEVVLNPLGEMLSTGVRAALGTLETVLGAVAGIRTSSTLRLTMA